MLEVHLREFQPTKGMKEGRPVSVSCPHGSRASVKEYLCVFSVTAENLHQVEENKAGPKMDPCGTPQVKWAGSELPVETTEAPYKPFAL